MHLNILGRMTVVVNNVNRAIELLDKRSANYSDRFIPRALSEMGWTESLPFLRYGKAFQIHRRMYQQHFSKGVTAKYLPVQLRQSRIFAQKLMQGPNVQKTEDAINTFVTAVIVRIVSGYHVTSASDPYIKLAQEVSVALATGGSGGGSLLDFFPILEYLPRWFPGTYYAYYARDNFPKVKALYDYTFDDVQTKMVGGPSNLKFLRKLIER
ncbi:hypothetical protein H0H87_006845 [Tephrocybe sp. NHM501043]|nr:hypothetical protein H0H87_006845 [Tephrocybe sp. NHM501043]